MYSFELVKDLIEAKTGSSRKVTAESSFSDLGIDKLDIVDILVTLEQELNITFDDKDLMDIETIQDILKLIEKNTK